MIKFPFLWCKYQSKINIYIDFKIHEKIKLISHTLQKSGNMLYSLSSLSLSLRGWLGCVNSANNFFKCIRPSAMCCEFWFCSSFWAELGAAEAAEPPPPTLASLRIIFILLAGCHYLQSQHHKGLHNAIIAKYNAGEL
jgi:hypothetical protein